MLLMVMFLILGKLHVKSMREYMAVQCPDQSNHGYHQQSTKTHQNDWESKDDSSTINKRQRTHSNPSHTHHSHERSSQMKPSSFLPLLSSVCLSVCLSVLCVALSCAVVFVVLWCCGVVVWCVSLWCCFDVTRGKVAESLICRSFFLSLRAR